MATKRDAAEGRVGWSRRLRAAAANASLAGASVLLGLIALELGVRLLGGDPGRGKQDRARSQYVVSDPLLGWRKRPGARARYDRREYQTELSINSFGMRDVERAARVPAGAVRVLALGDSFVEGYSVSAGATVTRQLESRLRGALPCAVEVLNGGTSGWSTDQEYLYYREEAAQLGARVVLLFLYYNDVLANVRQDYWGAAKPMLEEDGGRLVVAARPTPRPGRAPRARPPVTPESEPAAGPRSWYRSELAELVRARLAHGRPRLYQRLAGWGLFPAIDPEPPPSELSIFEKQPPPLLQAAWQRTLAILAALREEVESRSGRLLVVYVPAAFEVDDRAWELTRYRYGLAEEAWERDGVARRLAAASRRRGLELLDLTPSLRAAQARDATYFTYDPHWNARGHAVAAGAVADRLVSARGLACP